MKNTKQKLRTIVYIDGYNLYYGLRAAYKTKYKWLDLQALAYSFIQQNMDIVAVKYFTAISKSDSKTKMRQEIFLKALSSHCDKLKIIYGRFLSKTRQCRECGDKELCKVADGFFSISKLKIQTNQLPHTVINKNGKKLTKPEAWD